MVAVRGHAHGLSAASQDIVTAVFCRQLYCLSSNTYTCTLSNICFINTFKLHSNKIIADNFTICHPLVSMSLQFVDNLTSRSNIGISEGSDGYLLNGKAVLYVHVLHGSPERPSMTDCH